MQIEETDGIEVERVPEKSTDPIFSSLHGLNLVVGGFDIARYHRFLFNDRA